MDLEMPATARHSEPGKPATRNPKPVQLPQLAGVFSPLYRD